MSYLVIEYQRRKGGKIIVWNYQWRAKEYPCFLCCMNDPTALIAVGFNEKFLILEEI